MNNKSQKHTIDVLFVIALFCIFALSAIFLISIGANIYRKTVVHMDKNFNMRTAVAYVTEKVHQNDRTHSVHVGSLDNSPAIILESQENDVLYYTYIYEYDGNLKELMMREDVTLSPSAGQNILALQSFKVTIVNDSLMQCSLTLEDGESLEFYISVHSGGLFDEY